VNNVHLRANAFDLVAMNHIEHFSIGIEFHIVQNTHHKGEPGGRAPFALSG
jgi:hypothetical protein